VEIGVREFAMGRLDSYSFNPLRDFVFQQWNEFGFDRDVAPLGWFSGTYSWDIHLLS